MTDLIKRSDVLQLLSGSDIAGYKPSALREMVERVPAVDAVPVVHGRWVDHLVRDWRCSECGEKIQKVRNVDGYCYDDKPKYCPNCGAKMDGKDGAE